MEMGKFDAKHKLTVVRRLCGHEALGPSGVFDQSLANTVLALSLPPARKSAPHARRFSSGFEVMMTRVVFPLGQLEAQAALNKGGTRHMHSLISSACSAKLYSTSFIPATVADYTKTLRDHEAFMPGGDSRCSSSSCPVEVVPGRENVIDLFAEPPRSPRLLDEVGLRVQRSVLHHRIFGMAGHEQDLYVRLKGRESFFRIPPLPPEYTWPLRALAGWAFPPD